MKAKYDGTCPECHERIKVGQEIRKLKTPRAYYELNRSQWDRQQYIYLNYAHSWNCREVKNEVVS